MNIMELMINENSLMDNEITEITSKVRVILIDNQKNINS